MKKLISLILASIICFSVFYFQKKEEITPENTSFLTLSSKNVKFDDIGQSKTLLYEVGPEKYADSEVVWSSSDESVATCEGGVISSVGYGICVVQAKASTGASSSCIVRVENPNLELYISVTDQVFGDVGQTLNIVATDSYGNDVTSEVSWTTSNRNVATCYYGVVKSTGFGICTVKAITKNGITASCVVRVVDPDAATLSLSKSIVDFDEAGEETDIAAISSNEMAQIKWISSNSSVAEYNRGRIIAKGKGTCAIIAVADNGLSAAVVVNVGKKEYGPSAGGELFVDVEGIPQTVKYIDKQTGETVSEALVVGCNLTYKVISETRVMCFVEFDCVKIYDRYGSTGKNLVPINFNLGSKKTDKVYLDETEMTQNIQIGKSFSVKFDFIAEVAPGEMRDDLYVTVAEFVER